MAVSLSSSNPAGGPRRQTAFPETQPLDKLWKPTHVSIYEQGAKIGQGTYGHVFVGRSPDGRKVALKRIKPIPQEGFPITAIREIKILKALNAAATPDNPHPGKHNIVRLYDVTSSHSHEVNSVNADGFVFMVFEFCDHDLKGLIESKVAMRPSQIKYYMREILRGLDFCHQNKVLHRDIKPANILISNNGDVRLADFGLARNEHEGSYTTRVVSLWYRPPELLFGGDRYSNKVDIWSAACLFAELLTGGQVLFRGQGEMDQLAKIFDKCGTPDETDWPELLEMQMYKPCKPKQHRARKLKDIFRNHDPKALDLLDKMLALNPKDRLSAKMALEHEYFHDPADPVMRKGEHPNYQSQLHSMEVKRHKLAAANAKQSAAASRSSVVVGKKRSAPTIDYGFGGTGNIDLTTTDAPRPPPPPPPQQRPPAVGFPPERRAPEPSPLPPVHHPPPVYHSNKRARTIDPPPQPRDAHHPRHYHPRLLPPPPPPGVRPSNNPIQMPPGPPPGPPPYGHGAHPPPPPPPPAPPPPPTRYPGGPPHRRIPRR